VLKLRRGVVVAADPLEVEIDGERRRAWADESMVGEMGEGDEVIVNVEALDLGLGSGGFDVVHVNLTRGLGGEGNPALNVLKLNYTSLQHPVEAIEPAQRASPAGGPPVLVLSLHGQLAPAAWAAARAAPEIAVGYLQTPGGALPGFLSRDVVDLRERGLLRGHITAGAAYGGESEAISVAGGIDAAPSLGWEAVIAGPGPGILGSGSELGHGGMAALDTAHAALALGCPTALAPRLSSGDERSRHRGLSHHTATVLGLLLAGVRVAVPAGSGDEEWREPLAAACGERHDAWEGEAPLGEYAESGLPSTTMGRALEDDPAFFAAALAGGAALASLVRQQD
jgi:hypothetical protein